MLEVRDLMNREVVTIGIHDDVDLAELTMRVQECRHLPVLKNGKLVGMLTLRDVLRAQVSSVSNVPRERVRAESWTVQVGQVMTRDVLTIGPHAPAAEAARLMRDRKLGCLPVVEDDRLVGIITTADFLDLVIERLSS